MNKVELIAAVAEKEDITKVESEKIVNAVLDTIVETVASGEPVKIAGFGIFDQVSKAERQGVNPKTGASITIAAKKAPKFKAGKAFKDAVK